MAISVAGKSVLVVAHDAGGAELVSSWVLRQKQADLTCFLGGPAVEIFERKLGTLRRENLRAVSTADVVVAGTSSSGQKMEQKAIFVARRLGIPSVVYLDHWKGYRERFGVLPDEIWVTDQWAAALARRELTAEAKVFVRGNPYVEDVLFEYRQFDSWHRRGASEPERVLYVSEPAREREFQRWVKRSARVSMNLRERPHPAIATPSRSLAEDLAWADQVVGFDSMALAIAARVGKRAVTLLPPTEPLSIPWPGIERLYDYRGGPPLRTVPEPSQT